MIKGSAAVSQGYDVEWKLIRTKLNTFYFVTQRNPIGRPFSAPVWNKGPRPLSEGQGGTSESKLNNKENST